MSTIYPVIINVFTLICIFACQPVFALAENQSPDEAALTKIYFDFRQEALQRHEERAKDPKMKRFFRLPALFTFLKKNPWSSTGQTLRATTPLAL